MIMAHVKMMDRSEEGKPTPIPPDAQIRAHNNRQLLAAVIRAQHSDDDTTAMIVSASLASDHARLFGPVEDGAKPISTPKNSMDWDTTIDAAGFTIISHINNGNLVSTRKIRRD